MKSPFASKMLSPPTRRRVELSIAVAQERLLSTHVDHALALIKLVGDQMPFDDALDIYNRLLRLPADDTRIITTRALAILGERAAVDKEWPELVSEPQEDGESKRPFLSHLRNRLRGRVREDLRQWIELSAARTEVALLETHVENAVHFVEILRGEIPFHEAVDLYLDALQVRESIAEVTYYRVLTRLAVELLPNQVGATAAGETKPALTLAARQSPLRVAEQGG